MSIETSVPQADMPSPLVYPNPSNGDLRIDLAGNSIRTLNVFNAQGALVQQRSVSNLSILDHRLPETPGVYLLQFETEDGRTGQQRVIRN
jgi:hypothetical protein